MIQATKSFAAIGTFLGGMALAVSQQLQPAAEAFRTLGAVVLALFVLCPHVVPHVVGLGEGQGTNWAAEGSLPRVSRHVSSQLVRRPEVPSDANGTGVVHFPRRRRSASMSSSTGIANSLECGFTALIRTLSSRRVCTTV